MTKKETKETKKTKGTRKLPAQTLLSRRATLRWLGAAGTTALLGGGGQRWLMPTGQAAAAPAGMPAQLWPTLINSALFPANVPTPVVRDISQMSCVTKPALTEGPYFVDERLNRADIRADPSTGTVKAGVPLKLKINVSRVSGSACTPLVGALVDVWHCDALGAYSDIAAGAGNPNTLGQKFLRGYLLSDANGATEFTTIYPGYYVGRTVHIHYKVRLFSGTSTTYEFTSQLCFDDTLTDQVFTQAPYNTKSARGTRNSNDNIYQSGGTAILLNLVSDGAGGYTTTFDLGLSGVPATVAGVSTVSAASFTQGSLASETIAALFGSDLATSTASATNGTLPTELGGASVRVRDANGTERSASLFFASPTQINFLVPAGTSTGSATILVQRSGSTIAQGTLTIETVAPGLFTANASGSGVPAAVALRVKSDGTQSIEPVAQYDQTQNRYVATSIDLGAATDSVYLVLFGTGFRNRTSLSAVTATIGGVSANVSFAGAQGQLAGLDQANVLLPRSLAGRGAVNVVLGVDGKTTNTVSVNIK